MRTFALIYCWAFIVALTVGGVYLLWHWNVPATPNPPMVGVISLALAGYLVYGLHFSKR